MATILLPPDKANTVVEAYMSRHGVHLRGESLRLTARVQDGSVFAQLDLSNLNETFHYKMEVSMDVPENDGVPVDDVLDICLDFLDWYLGEYFQSAREIILPLDLHPHRFGEHTVLARGEVRKPYLDDAADAWLRGDRPEVKRRR